MSQTETRHLISVIPSNNPILVKWNSPDKIDIIQISILEIELPLVDVTEKVGGYRLWSGVFFVTFVWIRSTPYHSSFVQEKLFMHLFYRFLCI